MRLKNKSAVVTGASSGIGRAIAELFAREGAAVVVADLNEAGGQEVVAAIRSAGGRAEFVRCDVANEAECKAACDAAVRAFGGLNVVVNNAAAFIYGSVEETTYDQWQKVWNVNVVGQAQMVKSALPALRKAGGGAVVNIASQSSFIAQANYVPYNSSKAGILQLTRCLALDLAKDNVRVNAVSPGTIKTPAVDHCIHVQGMTLEEGYKRFGEDAVLKRLGEPIEIANAVLFLASDEASYITGANLVVDGGATID